LEIAESEEGLVLVTSSVDIRNEPPRRVLATFSFTEVSPVGLTPWSTPCAPFRPG